MDFIVAEKEICEAGSNSLRLIENPRLNVVFVGELWDGSGSSCVDVI